MSISTTPMTRRRMPMIHRMWILNTNPAMRRTIPRMIIAFTWFRCRCTGAGSVFEDVFDLGPRLLGVGLGLIGASLGAQPGVAGGATEQLLGGALGGLGLVRDLLTDTHCGFPSSSVITDRGCGLTVS